MLLFFKKPLGTFPAVVVDCDPTELSITVVFPSLRLHQLCDTQDEITQAMSGLAIAGRLVQPSTALYCPLLPPAAPCCSGAACSTLLH